MPIIYLSPSSQEFNRYVDGGNEEYYMNLIADEMIPYLDASRIQYVRNNPSQTLQEVISESNSSIYDLHLAIHSNAAPPNLAGLLRGTDVYYSPLNPNSKRAAEIIANNFKTIYPDPSLVKTVPTNTLAEVRNVLAPSVLIEVAYHDNPQDAEWIRNNTENIAANLVLSVADYLGVPFINTEM